MTDPYSDPEQTGQPGADDPRSSGAGTAAGDTEADGNDPIARLTRERDDYRDQALRARAEFANYQKRAKQQADADRTYAVGSLAKDLLDPLDNLVRAIEHLRGPGAEGISSGLNMVHRQLLDVLAKHGVEPIEAMGQPFDPNLHEALIQQPTPDHPEGTVVNELSKGYRIRDRVLRPSKVAVSSRPAQG